MAAGTVKHLSKDEVVARLANCKKMMEVFVEIDTTRTKTFLDPAVIPIALSGGEETVNVTDPEIQQDVPIGQSNLLTASLLVKLAVVAINRPDWHVIAQKPEVDQQGNETGKMVADPESAQIWRQYKIDEWDRKNHQRTALRTLLKRYVCGLGCVAWSWGDAGAKFEHVQSWDYGVDPFVTDWQAPGYGRRLIRMSLTEAADRYPDGPFKDDIGRGGKTKADSQMIEIEVYWDADTEAHIYQDKWLIHKDVKSNPDPKANLYNRVPLLFLEGDLHPGKTPFPLGDSVLAASSQAELSDLSQSVSNTAKAGSGFVLFDSAGEQLDKTAMDAFEKGEQQQYIGVKGLDTQNPPIHRIQGEELRGAVLDARKEAKDDLLSLIGISQMDMGLFNDRPQFATQVAATVQKGGARQNQAKAEYETFLNRWAKIDLFLFREFGGPHKHPETGEIIASPEHERLHEAAMRVTEVKIVEGSTAYKDPSVQQQQSMQLLQLVMQVYPMLVSLANMGLIDELPNVKFLFNRAFRAFDINQTDQMWVPYQGNPQAGQQQGKPPLEMISYKDAPEDVRRQMEAQAGMQPSQEGEPAEAPDVSPHVELEKQARDHLHEVGLKQMEHAHAQRMAEVAAINAERAAQTQAVVGRNGKH